MPTWFLYAITILSGVITIITGSVTIIGYFQRKPVSSSQPVIQPSLPSASPSQQNYAPSHQPYVEAVPQFGNTVLPKTLKGLSYPRIALIALIGQVLAFVVLALSLYSPTTVTIAAILLIGLVAIACATTALVMGLLKAKQLQRWGWFTSLIIGFVCLFILFLPALIPLLFGIFGPREQRTVISSPANELERMSQ